MIMRMNELLTQMCKLREVCLGNLNVKFLDLDTRVMFVVVIDKSIGVMKKSSK